MATLTSPYRKRLRSEGFENGKIVKESLPNLSDDEIGSPTVGSRFLTQKMINVNAFQETEKINDVNRSLNFVQKHAKALVQLYEPHVEAKIWGVAAQGLSNASPSESTAHYPFTNN